jgi:hypothetical protein
LVSSSGVDGEMPGREGVPALLFVDAVAVVGGGGGVGPVTGAVERPGVYQLPGMADGSVVEFVRRRGFR